MGEGRHGERAPGVEARARGGVDGKDRGGRRFGGRQVHALGRHPVERGLEEAREFRVAEVFAQEADARVRAVRAAAPFVEEDGEGLRESDAVRGGQGVEEPEAEARFEADAAAEVGLEDGVAVDGLREEAEVVRLGENGVGRAVRKGDLELAGETVGGVEGGEGA